MRERWDRRTEKSKNDKSDEREMNERERLENGKEKQRV